MCVCVTVRVSNQGFSQIPKTFRESVKFTDLVPKCLETKFLKIGGSE